MKSQNGQLKMATDNLWVDGTFIDGTFQGDGEDAPFVVFDIDAQQNLPGIYETREEAEIALAAELVRRST